VMCSANFGGLPRTTLYAQKWKKKMNAPLVFHRPPTPQHHTITFEVAALIFCRSLDSTTHNLLIVAALIFSRSLDTRKMI
jgi:hypothetical protein